MKFVGLVSGGKDSLHCMVHAVAFGHVPVSARSVCPSLARSKPTHAHLTVTDHLACLRVDPRVCKLCCIHTSAHQSSFVATLLLCTVVEALRGSKSKR
jgi:diphthamide synthase (EF-2-diphthine--ammonia ligase)